MTGTITATVTIDVESIRRVDRAEKAWAQADHRLELAQERSASLSSLQEMDREPDDTLDELREAELTAMRRVHQTWEDIGRQVISQLSALDD